MSFTLEAIHSIIIITFWHNANKGVGPASGFWAWDISSGDGCIHLTYQPKAQRVSCMEETST
jgi:hypothetical protein